jgi:hypothetical protein
LNVLPEQPRLVEQLGTHINHLYEAIEGLKAARGFLSAAGSDVCGLTEPVSAASAHLSCGGAAFVEDQAVDVVCQVGECDLGFGAAMPIERMNNPI